MSQPLHRLACDLAHLAGLTAPAVRKAHEGCTMPMPVVRAVKASIVMNKDGAIRPRIGGYDDQ